MRTSIVLCLVLLLFSVSSSAKVDHRSTPPLIPVPIVRQATEYSCGAAALHSVLMYWQVFDGGEMELHAPLKTNPKEGTDWAEMLRYAQESGLTATAEEKVTFERLQSALLRGETVIVDFQAWSEKTVTAWKEEWEDGHYSVVVGLDESNVYLMDPSAGPSYAFVPRAEFMERWHDYENRNGQVVKSYQLGLFIHGTTPMSAFPGNLTRVQ